MQISKTEPSNPPGTTHLALRQPAEDDGPGLGGGICRGIANELHLECGSIRGLEPHVVKLDNVDAHPGLNIPGYRTISSQLSQG